MLNEKRQIRVILILNTRRSTLIKIFMDSSFDNPYPSLHTRGNKGITSDKLVVINR